MTDVLDYVVRLAIVLLCVWLFRSTVVICKHHWCLLREPEASKTCFIKIAVKVAISVALYILVTVLIESPAIPNDLVKYLSDINRVATIITLFIGCSVGRDLHVLAKYISDKEVTEE